MTMVYNDGGFIVLGVSINVGTPIAGWLNKMEHPKQTWMI